jgi:predicted acylesterase/phospholipase RssA
MTDTGCAGDFEELKKAIRELKGQFDFDLARRRLEAARTSPLALCATHKLWIVQQLALCTYKDEELPPSARFDDALALLESIGLRDPNNKNAETLGLGGAVYKRKWERGGKLEDAYASLNFYRAAYESNPGQDLGFGGVNAALLLDILASRLARIARRSGGAMEEAAKLREEAKSLRQAMRNSLPAAAEHSPGLSHDYWYLATLAEIEFGLENYKAAGEWLQKAAALEPGAQASPANLWMLQTTAEQFAKLARLHHAWPPAETDAPDAWHPAWRALISLVSPEAVLALSAQRGKVGLALSGGGFRASFFHLGVLARLAEVDALRGVEVLSTVSGGSILGAHYYLEVQRLLETKLDSIRAPEADGATNPTSAETITREDYIDIVRRVQKDFLEGVESNIRMSAFADFRRNLKMLFGHGYTRSHFLGELYEERLYAKIGDRPGPRDMHQLLVAPKGEAAPFKPKFANWRRRAKAPVLLLASTSLNSGHNWHFTASWMGEPPGLLVAFDANERYRRLYYRQAPSTLQKYRLGHAVAASACVPGLFEPLTIEGLYPDRTVRLVDGGVHDNQGVAGLIDEGCALILCSDASGQMTDLRSPSEDPPNVVMRASSVLQARVREAEYQDLRSRADSRSVEGFMFLHLKKGLHVDPLPWVGCTDDQAVGPDERKDTDYHVNKQLQRLIAGIRTDLDSFSEVEAYSLMASGYLMTKLELEELQERHDQEGASGTWGGYKIDAPSENWPFFPLIELLGQEPEKNDRAKDLAQQLEVASASFLKAWRLVPSLKSQGKAGVATIAVAVLASIYFFWGVTAFSMTVGGAAISLLAFAVAFFAPALRWLFPHQEAQSVLLKVAIALAGYLFSKFHLKWIDKCFLEHGRLSRLLGP